MKVKHVNLIPIIISLALILFNQNSYSQPASKDFKLALVQMYVEPGHLEKNLAHAEELIQAAAAANAQVVLFPEVMDLGWTHTSAKTMASPIPDGKTCKHMSKLAKKYNVYLCFGMVEKDGDQMYNSAVILDNKGNLQLKHRKLNELDIAHDLYAQGDRLGVCPTPWGTFGLMICADATAKGNVITRSLAYMGADVILSPSSWAVPPDHDNQKDPYGKTWFDAYQPVAREYGLWIASASNVGPVTEGPWENWKCIGCSMVISPEGKTIIMGPYGEKAEKIIYCDIPSTPRPARGTGWYYFKPAN